MYRLANLEVMYLKWLPVCQYILYINNWCQVKKDTQDGLLLAILCAQEEPHTYGRPI